MNNQTKPGVSRVVSNKEKKKKEGTETHVTLNTNTDII